MNRRYRLLLDDATPRCVAVPETAWGHAALLPAALLLGALLAPAAQARDFPKGGAVVSGDLQISKRGKQMTIDQQSPKAILDWQSFDIGTGKAVHFQQPGANAIALNRVTGGDASQIKGKLSANGQVWLVNPNGVVFGQGSQVNVGGLVASTLNITNEDFDAGRQLFHRGAAQGGITNRGNIAVADGGMLALLAPTVRNEGTLTARLGNVVLAGGDTIALSAGAQGLLDVLIPGSTVRTLMENRHLIVADGGQVVMTARAADALSAAVVSNAGTVQAQTLAQRSGCIVLQAEERSGNVEAKVLHSGLLDASAPDGGHGGEVVTIASTLDFAPQSRVTTAAPQGIPGNWSIAQTNDLTIDAGNAPGGIRSIGIEADMLMTNLAHTHISVNTLLHPGAREEGDIHVNAGLRHDRNQLTLNARRDIHINAPVSVEGMGTLQMNYGQTQGSRHVSPDPGSKLHVLPGQGQVSFAQSGANLLHINGHGFEVIRDVADLQSMGHADRLGGNYAMGRSMDASGFDFEPIGNERHPFKGSFDGLGHTIGNLAIERPGQVRVGLFGLATSATLRNVKLEGTRVVGRNCVGGLVGELDAFDGTASISNATVIGQVKGASSVGGLVGSMGNHSGTVSLLNTHFQGQASGTWSIGGLAGTIQSRAGTVSISNAHADGDVSGLVSVGGLVGASESSDRQGRVHISDVRVTGKVTGQERIGGVIGANEAHGSGRNAQIYNSQSSSLVNYLPQPW